MDLKSLKVGHLASDGCGPVSAKPHIKSALELVETRVNKKFLSTTLHFPQV